MRSVRNLGRVVVVLALGLVGLAPMGCDCCTRSSSGLWSAQSTEKSDPAARGRSGIVAQQVEKSKAS
jgi:hypothetical protein